MEKCIYLNFPEEDIHERLVKFVKPLGWKAALLIGWTSSNTAVGANFTFNIDESATWIESFRTYRVELVEHYG